MTHCQICGRAIRAGNGLIAHHGYTRPGNGWQTKSCFGARYRPYEVACDALVPAIESISRYLGQTQATLDDLMTDPPATIEHVRYRYDRVRRGFNNPREAWTADRPDGFDPHNPGIRANMPKTYEYAFATRTSGLRGNIRSATESLAAFHKRLADWRPAAA